MKKALALVLAFLMLFALFAACGKKDGSKDSGTANPDSGKPSTPQVDSDKTSIGENLSMIDKDAVHPSEDAVLKFAGSADPPTLCYLAGSGSSNAYTAISIFYDSLVSYDSNACEIIPCLATEWEWLDDLTIRMTLREDVVSHMGDPFSASDVVFTIQTGCANAKLSTVYGSVFNPEGCKVVDKYVVDIALKAPNAFFLYDLSKPNSGMVVEESVKKLGGFPDAGDKPLMATGPYMITEWDRTNQVVYAERNENYWGTLPYYKKYESHTVPDTTARNMGVEAGDFNCGQAPNASAIISAEKNSALTTYVTPGSGLLRWDLNSDREPLNIKEFRQALALAVNYEAIMQVCYSGYADPVDSVYPICCTWYTAPADGEEDFYFYYDTARAKEKLVEAGCPDGAELGIMFSSGNSVFSMAVEILQNSLRDINVTLVPEQYEAATFNDRRNNHDFDTMINNTMNSTPASPLKQFDPRLLGYCGTKWLADDEANILALIDNCRTTANLEKCLEYLAEFQDLARDYCFAIPVGNQKNFNITSSDIVNVAYDYSGTILPATFYTAEYLAG